MFTSANIYGEYNSAICEFDYAETMDQFAPYNADIFVRNNERETTFGKWSTLTKSIPNNVTHPGQCDQSKFPFYINYIIVYI